MKLLLEGYGPIKRAEIELGDITLFLGPPNVGKSYTLKAIHSALAVLDGYVLKKASDELLNYVSKLVATSDASKRVDVRDLLWAFRSIVRKYEAMLMPAEPSKFLKDVQLDVGEREVIKAIKDCVEQVTEALKPDFDVRGRVNDKELVVEGNSEEDVKEGLFDILMCALPSLLFELQNKAYEVLGVSRVVYVPYGKHLLLVQLESAPQKLYEAVDYFPMNLSCALDAIANGRSKLIRKELDEDELLLLKMSIPLLQGKIEVEGRTLQYKDWRGAKVELLNSSALAGEVVATLLSLLGRPSLILMEEPEGQLHPSAQALVAVFLVALTALSYKAVVTTHSDLIAITLALLFKHKPSREKLEELVKSLSPVSEGIEELVELAEKGLSGAELKVYEFKRDGTVEAISPETLVERVPGITEVLDALTSWASGL